jgi:3'-phosphoadenosine 5'-phosphosulfate sulfotransferase (PAPS reductase)/FAD synthetase
MNRWDIINSIITSKNYESYLEIGCAYNECFDKIECIYKVGVDPIRGGNTKLTSTEFFKTNTDSFDIIFIDGLHHSDQVYEDITNALNVLNAGGIILIHDALPNNYASQLIPISVAASHPEFNGGWCGDVWKTVMCMRTFRDIDICTTHSGGGIAFLIKRDNTSVNVVEKNMYEWEHYIKHRDRLMNIKQIQEAFLWML